MKVTMIKTAASPQGVARVGTVLDVKEEEAKAMVAQLAARPFDPQMDAKKPRGWRKAHEAK